jgi:uncharacterized protein (DUF342 family)
METASIVSSIVSLVLGVYAIWLSITFYRMSTGSSNEIKESAKDLASSVTRLEKLFDRLYADTFSMMRDTVSDMRKHLWPESKEEQDAVTEVERRADEKAAQIQEELEKQVSALTQKLGGTDARVRQLRDELMPMVEDAISRSRHVESEAREETLRDRLLSALSAKDRSFNDLYEITKSSGFSFQQLFTELQQLNKDGLVDWPGAPRLDAFSPISLRPEQLSRRTGNTRRKQSADAGS